MKSSKELKRIPYERNVTFNDGNFDDLKNDGRRMKSHIKQYRSM